MECPVDGVPAGHGLYSARKLCFSQKCYRGKGLLFDIPTSLKTDVLIDHYHSLAIDYEDGWHLCPSGHALYVFWQSHHECIVVPGLYVDGLSTVLRTSESTSIASKEALEEHAVQALEAFNASTDALHSELRAYVHEIKKINAAIYNQSVELLQQFKTLNIPASLTPRVVSIIENANLLRMRSDLMQFVANPEFDLPARAISAQASFKRIADMFTNVFSAKNLSVVCSADFEVYGPDFFDLVPFIAVENAIKYCPEKYGIQISIENRTNEHVVKIFTTGPKIEDDEFAKIFLGYRGRNALKVSEEGEGIGLPTLKKLVEEHFEGTVNISQREKIAVIKEVEFYEIVYRFEFPKESMRL